MSSLFLLKTTKQWIENQMELKKLCETNSVKYLRSQIDKNLTWKQERLATISNAAIKLNKANAMLSKLIHVLYIKTLYTTIIQLWILFILSLYFVAAKPQFSYKNLYIIEKSPLNDVLLKSKFSYKSFI